MADHSKPTLTDNYADWPSLLDSRFDDLAVGMDPAVTTVTNPPTDAIRWTSSANTWQKWNGTTWGALSSSYSINISGNAATAAALQTARTINGVSFNGSANISLPTVNTSGDQSVLGLKTFSGLATSRTAVTVPAATDGNIFSGTYTPTQVSTNTNVDSVTYAASQYMRVGNTGTVSTSITVDPTAAASTVVKFSLPIASNLGSYTQCVGTAVGGSSQVGYISGDTTNDCAVLTFTATNTGPTIFYVTFTYQVL